MDKKRLTLLLTDDQIRVIKSKAALAGLPANQWVIEQLNLEAEAQADEPAQADPVPEAVTDDTAVVEPDPVPDPEPASAPQDEIIPDCSGREIEKAERDQILLQLAEKMPGSAKDVIQARVDLLNKCSIPVDTRPGRPGGEWNRKRFTDLLRLAKKRK